jgi:hypothetical protein
MDTTQKPIIGDANTIPNLEASGQALLNRNLTTQQITPTSPLNLNSTITQPTDNGSNIVTSASSTSADIQKYLDMVNSQQPTETQNTFNDLVKSLSGDTSLTGRGEAQLSAEQSAGLPDFYKNLADVNSQITTRTAEYNKMLADMEVGVRGSGNTDIRSSLLYGQQGAVNRQGAAEIGLLEARALGLQGKISAAQTAVNRAVDLMYQDREALYNQKLKQLELIQPRLNAEEKKRADATAYALKNEADKLAEEKQSKKDIQNIAIEAAKNGAPASVLTNIGKATSVADATVKAIGFFQDPLDVQYKKMQIANIKSEIANRGRDTGSEVDAANILAYAQQYAATGQIPTGLPKGTFGMVAQAAAALPKQKGEVVSTSTGIKSNTVGAELQKGITAIYDSKNLLAQMQTIFNNKKAGTFTNSDRITYETLLGEFADALSRTRSGAALTETEIQQYKSKLPSWNNLVGGTAKFNATNTSLTGKLDAHLSTNGLSMYGYSQVPIGNETFTVGDIIVNEAGQSGRINPDGSLTLIN